MSKTTILTKIAAASKISRQLSTSAAEQTAKIALRLLKEELKEIGFKDSETEISANYTQIKNTIHSNQSLDSLVASSFVIRVLGVPGLTLSGLVHYPHNSQSPTAEVSYYVNMLSGRFRVHSLADLANTKEFLRAGK